MLCLAVTYIGFFQMQNQSFAKASSVKTVHSTRGVKRRILPPLDLRKYNTSTRNIIIFMRDWGKMLREIRLWRWK